MDRGKVGLGDKGYSSPVSRPGHLPTLGFLPLLLHPRPSSDIVGGMYERQKRSLCIGCMLTVVYCSTEADKLMIFERYSARF